jgi:hypothetical protein
MNLALKILKWGLVGIGVLSVFIVGSLLMLIIAMSSDGIDEE